MPAGDRSLGGAIPLTDAGDLVQRVLDVLPVTDNVYHHLAFTRPLVEALAREVRRAGPAGRVLVLGPNELLPRVLVEYGYDVDLWVLDGLPLSDFIQRRASRCGQIDEVLTSGVADRADVLVAPYVAEATALEPGEFLRVLSTHVKPGGSLIVACRQPGELRRRMRRTFGKANTSASDEISSLSPTWPNLPAKRFLTSHDLARAGDGRFTMQRSGFVIDHRAYVTTEALTVWKWLLKVSLYTAKVAVPSFRDCTVVTLIRVEDASAEAAEV